MNDNGFVVCAYNRTTSKVDSFLENEAKGKEASGKSGHSAYLVG
jgi:6-phosphogluconate dehydrogenase